MKIITRLFLVLLLVMGVAFIGCSNDDSGSSYKPSFARFQPTVVLSKSLTAPSVASPTAGDTSTINGETVTFDGSYWVYSVTDTQVGITGAIVVNEGVKLKFAAGSIIIADTGRLSYLSIQQGAQIEAIGTDTTPIVFTSGNVEGERSMSDWGGIVIHGKAPVNNTSGLNSAVDTEIGTGPYGGNTPADNSGTLRYVRVEFAGYEIAAGEELNGIFLAGVGSGTTIEFVQVHRGSDDGIEIFGGTINLENIVLTYNDDDQFDLDEGWSGYAKNFVIAKGQTIGDCFIEYDGLGEDADRATQSLFTNFSMFGQGTGKKTNAIHIKADGALIIINSIFANLTDQFVNTESDMITTQSASDTFFANNGDMLGLNDNDGAANGEYINAVVSCVFENVYDGAVAAAEGDMIVNTGAAGGYDELDQNDFDDNDNLASFTAPTSYWGEGGADNFTPAGTIGAGGLALVPAAAITAWNGLDVIPDAHYGAILPGTGAGATWLEGWTDFSEN